jgi:hypothetical protein
MSISIANLLVHDDGVPAAARAAIRDALGSPAQAREPLLEAAARILYRETDVNCADARELVGLSAGCCG